MTLCLLCYFEFYEGAIVLEKKEAYRPLPECHTNSGVELSDSNNRICCDWTMKTLKVFQKMTILNRSY